MQCSVATSLPGLATADLPPCMTAAPVLVLSGVTTSHYQGAEQPPTHTGVSTDSLTD